MSVPAAKETLPAPTLPFALFRGDEAAAKRTIIGRNDALIFTASQAISAAIAKAPRLISNRHEWSPISRRQSMPLDGRLPGGNSIDGARRPCSLSWCRHAALPRGVRRRIMPATRRGRARPILCRSTLRLASCHCPAGDEAARAMRDR